MQTEEGELSFILIFSPSTSKLKVNLHAMTPLMIQNKWTGLEAPVSIPVVSFLNILPQCCLTFPAKS